MKRIVIARADRFRARCRRSSEKREAKPLELVPKPHRRSGGGGQAQDSQGMPTPSYVLEGRDSVPAKENTGYGAVLLMDQET